MDYIVLALIVSFCIILIFARDILSMLFPEQSEIRFSYIYTFTYLFALAVFAYFIAGHNALLSPLPLVMKHMTKTAVFFTLLGFFCGWALLRCALIKSIGWVIDQNAFTNLLERTGSDVFILTGFAFLPISFVLSYTGASNSKGMIVAVGIVFFLSFLFYAFRVLKLFLSARFSLFFWILYLCTLDIIPMGILIHFLVGTRL